ncbi:hypothetical protein ACFX2A_008718 [Malus domestica]
MDAPPTLPISNSQTTVGAQSQPPIATPVFHASISRHGFSQCRLWYELVDRTTLARPDSLIAAYSRSTLARPDSRIVLPSLPSRSPPHQIRLPPEPSC